MDEAAAAEIGEEGAERKTRSGDEASGNNGAPSTEETFDIKQYNIACKDCGLKFTHLDVFKAHLHQHAFEEEDELTEDSRSPAIELVSGRENSDDNRCDINSSLQTKPPGFIQGKGVLTASMKNNLRKVYACLVCGKVYTYLVPFRKHQKLHEVHSSTAKSQSVQNLQKYECPDCGMSFVRRTRLLSHLRVHKSHEPVEAQPPKCDQCNKEFSSMNLYVIHVKMHKEKPFWCLGCAKGFRDEALLDRHLQGHNLRQHKCDNCQKRFQTPMQLKGHRNQCLVCWKSFCHPENLVSHQKKHRRVYAQSGRKSLGIKSFAIMAKKQKMNQKRRVLNSVKNKPKVEAHGEVLPGKTEGVEESGRHKTCKAADSGDPVTSEDSDCGEPMHGIRFSNPLDSAVFDAPKVIKTEQQRSNKSDSRERNVHRDHRYWEWECFECDMGFDDVEKLHLHYIKHATGELPFPQDDIMA